MFTNEFELVIYVQDLKKSLPTNIRFLLLLNLQSIISLVTKQSTKTTILVSQAILSVHFVRAHSMEMTNCLSIVETSMSSAIFVLEMASGINTMPTMTRW
jgi:hypothetical protein